MVMLILFIIIIIIIVTFFSFCLVFLWHISATVFQDLDTVVL